MEIEMENKEVETKDPIKKLIIEVNGREYTLEYNRDAIKRIEQKGFSMVDFNTKFMTSIDLMIEGALFKNQKYLTAKDIDKIITSIYEELNISDLVEALSEMLTNAVPMFGNEDGEEKKGFKIVR